MKSEANTLGADVRAADRIIECVNALSGIPNPAAVRELVEACRIEAASTDERIQAALAALDREPEGV